MTDDLLPTTTHGKLEALAHALLDAALTQEMETKDKVDIFKPISLWYLGVQKARKGDPDDAGGQETFADLQQRLNPGNGALKQ